MKDAEQIQRWRWMLEQNVPLIGGWMHRRVASALNDSALSGNWLAAQSLAYLFVFHGEEDVRSMAAETLRRINYATGIDAVWGVWADTRHTGLEEIAVGYKRIANHPASVRLLSALRMAAYQSVTHGSADLVPPLIAACRDRSPELAARAQQVIARLHNQTSIDALCAAWQESRSPELAAVLQKAHYAAQKPARTRVLSALLSEQYTLVTHGGASLVEPLVEACGDPDEVIAKRAQLCLVQLQDQAAVDEFCRLWVETRGPLLEQALLSAGYQARAPEAVRLITALKTGRLQTAEETDPAGLPALLAATQDADAVVRENAARALNNLRREEARDSLGLRVIEQDDPLARQIAMANGYAPSAPEMRALFYFLTGQWQKYDELDFDQSTLRAMYEAGAPALRQRIAGQVQAAARTDYLTIMAGVDLRARAELVNPNEAALMIRVLADNREYDRLWQLAPELALPFSLEILHRLNAAGWQPAAEADRPVFAELSELARQPILLAGEELTRSLPLALPRATLKVKGRVNEVAFSPVRPVLAIGTSHRKVVLWNFQEAAVERVIEGFAHSVGKVSYLPDGSMVVAERTSTQTECGVYLYQGDEISRLCSHTGTVTVLEPVTGTNLLTTGRDNKAVLWDLTNREIVTQKEYAFWARSAAVSPDGQYAALLHDRLTLVRLPELTIVPGYPFITPRSDHFKPGVAQNAAFSPDGRHILTGQHNGQVGLHFHTSLTARPRKAVVTQHSKPVRGIHFLPGHPYVITAGAEGQVRFHRWPEMEQQGMVFSPGQLTSLRLSHNGAFMATGTSDAALVLWDLRVMDIAGLFSQPLAAASHDQITTVMGLSEYGTLPESVRRGLRFLRLLLQHRFRYDIQIEEAPMIQYGEFDIVLDEP